MATNTPVKIVTVQPRYPAATSTLLAFMHANKRVPSHVNPMEHRVLIAQPWALIRLGRWVHEGKLDIARPLVIADCGTSTALRIRWAIPGMPLAKACQTLGTHMRSNDFTVIAGHPLTGRQLDWPVTDDIGPMIGERGLTVTVLRNLGTPKAEACISSGWCVDVCPTELQPYRLMQKVLHNPKRRLLSELQWCVECGLCTHACPSAMDLAGTLREAKWRFLRQPGPEEQLT
jgi:electron transport complex protein RnfC